MTTPQLCLSPAVHGACALKREAWMRWVRACQLGKRSGSVCDLNADGALVVPPTPNGPANGLAPPALQRSRTEASRCVCREADAKSAYMPPRSLRAVRCDPAGAAWCTRVPTRTGGLGDSSALCNMGTRMEGGQRHVVGCCMLNAQCMPCMGYVSVTAGGVCITVAGGARRPRRISVPFFRL